MYIFNELKGKKVAHFLYGKCVAQIEPPVSWIEASNFLIRLIKMNNRTTKVDLLVITLKEKWVVAK